MCLKQIEMSLKNNKKEKYSERGFVIFLTVLISSIVLFIGVSVYNILNKHLKMSRITQHSQVAFYAADAGVECALYSDLKQEKFSTTSSSQIDCNEDSYTVTPRPKGGGVYKWIFYMNFEPDPYCAEVIVKKTIFPSEIVTKIESRGYNRGYDSVANNCSNPQPEKVQRAMEIKY